MTVRAVLFDFDGVIADTEGLHLRAFQRVLEPRGIAIDVATYNERSRLPYELSLSVGIAYLEPGSSTTLEELVRQADMAMYQNKRLKRGG